ncbi:Mitochondrial import inner membrane translocase subunit TIM50 [Leucoagaricus sp. SymC.cos]|nr:Mitochondrial import inner membrane translocase subunit TIM50 [Leucoagaricus sp. SymC.cos]
MFAVLSRPVQRRVLAHSARWMSQKPPSSSSSGATAPKELKPETTGTPETSQPESAPSLDFSPPEVEPAPKKEQQRTGARSSKGTLSASEKRRQNMGKVSFGLLGLSIALGIFYMGREWEVDELKEKKLKIEYAPQGRWNRTKERMGDLFDYFNKPAWTELLPPPYPPPHQKPYTLLISIDDLLVTSTWDRQHGWRTAKRPGVDYFLAYISQFYEVVIFTSQNYYTAIPILDKLDKYNFFIAHRLFREATRSINGTIVKDLSYLNRDLSKVVALDTESMHYLTHPENAIILPKWEGDPSDKSLVAMIPFLESIAIYKPADVRPILEAYQGKDIPIEYAKKEAEAKQKHIEEWKKKSHQISSGSFSSMFGLSQPSSTPSGQPPPTYLEQKRAEAQKTYLEEQKYIELNRETFDKLLEQEQQAMAAQTPGSLFEVFQGKKSEDMAAQSGQQQQPAPSTSQDPAKKA